MDNILIKIQRVTEELNEVQSELYRRALTPEPGPAHEFMNDPSGLEVLSRFKAAVDELRRFLWYYLDELASRQGADADLLIHGYRIRRATEMLRVLCHEPIAAESASLHDAQTFLELVTAVVEGKVPPRTADSR